MITSKNFSCGFSAQRVPVFYNLFAIAVILLAGRSGVADNWPAWRGPEGTGVCGETGLPLSWSEEEGSGIVWKTEIPEWGNSTPVIWNDAIFITTQVDDRLLILRVNKLTGQLMWTRKVGTADTPRDAPRGKQKFHHLNNNASPSVVTDGRHVAAHFGNGDLAVFDFAGNLLWRRNLQADYGKYTIWWGHANSPVIVDGLVISVCMQDSLADLQDKPHPSYLVAHELETGKEVWFTPRITGAMRESCDAYTTPLVRRLSDRTEIIVMGAEQLDAYDAQTGKQIWYLPGLTGNRTITGPTIDGEIVYATIGMRGATFAARIGGQGRLPDQRILWRYEGNNPDSPSPVYYDGFLYLAADNGIVQCLDARTGELQWRERLGREFKASPLAAEGRIYFLDTSGRCTVIRAGATFEVLSLNKVADRTIASPAVSDGRIFIRGRKFLYCVGRPFSN